MRFVKFTRLKLQPFFKKKSLSNHLNQTILITTKDIERHMIRYFYIYFYFLFLKKYSSYEPIYIVASYKSINIIYVSNFELCLP